MAIKVVTDSTADLTKEEAATLGVTIVPLNVLFGSESLLDHVEISPQEFFRRLTSERTLPKTSQPPAGAFADAYGRLFQEGAGAVVSVHISARLSGTINSARTAREALDDPSKVTILDSGTVSAAMAYGVRAAAEAASAGCDQAEAARAARDALRRTRLLVVLDTLEYLQKGGRIGRARAWIGGVLNIKPLLSVVDGEVVPVERVRTYSRALERMIELAAQRPSVVDATILHSGPEDEAERVRARLSARLSGVNIRIGWLGPVVGVYTGPRAIGIVTLAKDEGSG